MIFWLIFESLTLIILVFLGDKRSKMFVAAAFVLCVNISALIPIYYFIATFIYPLTEINNIYEIAYKYPHIYYMLIFSVNAIITGCCLIASHWLRDTKINPPLKIYSIFSFFYIAFSLIVTIWWSDIRKNMSIPFLTTAFMGILLLAILIYLFYLYTKLIGKNTNINGQKEIPANSNSQFIQKLSRRELEVIRTILEGNNRYKEIADKLNISVNTVKFHLKNIYKITKVSNISDLLSFFNGINLNP
jgi:DNA-binding CsgD family transcriptional regulator